MGQVDGIKQGGTFLFMKHDTRGCTLVQIFLGSVNHRIRQSAGFAYNGDGAVTQAVKLVQSTGLKPGRH